MAKNQEVPELNIEDNKVVMPKRQVPLKINGEKQEITIRKLSTGERNDIRQKCVTTKMRNGQTQTDLNSEEWQERLLSKSIVDAPFDTNRKGIKALPDDVSDYLFKQYNKFGEPSKKKSDE